MFCVVVHTPASTPIQLDLEEGTSASEVIQKALQCLGLPDNEEIVERAMEGWSLRARRYVEEGKWWSENDIDEYSDRKSGPAGLHQAYRQLYWAVKID